MREEGISSSGDPLLFRNSTPAARVVVFLVDIHKTVIPEQYEDVNIGKNLIIGQPASSEVGDRAASYESRGPSTRKRNLDEGVSTVDRPPHVIMQHADSVEGVVIDRNGDEVNKESSGPSKRVCERESYVFELYRRDSFGVGPSQTLYFDIERDAQFHPSAIDSTRASSVIAMDTVYHGEDNNSMESVKNRPGYIDDDVNYPSVSAFKSPDLNDQSDMNFSGQAQHSICPASVRAPDEIGISSTNDKEVLNTDTTTGHRRDGGLSLAISGGSVGMGANLVLAPGIREALASRLRTESAVGDMEPVAEVMEYQGQNGEFAADPGVMSDFVPEEMDQDLISRSVGKADSESKIVGSAKAEYVESGEKTNNASKRPNTDDVQDDTTRQDPNTTVIHLAGPPKKPTIRSTERSAADYLQQQNCIGQFNHYPLRKHTYITVYITRILDSLVTLYVHLLKLNWDRFARTAEKFPLPSGVTDHYHYLAYVYLSHWANDLYYSIRKSCQTVNPLAFVERYHKETGRYADRYDKFLTLLINAIKPTPIVGAIADEIYIPVLGKDVDITKKKNVFGWSHWIIDSTVFQLVHQSLELKKVTTFVPISDDPTGRASWLFDWFDNAAYAWFPFDANYNEIDITVAYILGVACTPKVSLPDTDDWRYCAHRTDLKRIDLESYARVIPRRRFGTSEHRLLESEEVTLPNYYEKDKDKHSKLNVGPLAIKKLTAEEDEAESSKSPDPDYVPESPRPLTRSQAVEGVGKCIRLRVHDYIYYTKSTQRSLSCNAVLFSGLEASKGEVTQAVKSSPTDECGFTNYPVADGTGPPNGESNFEEAVEFDPIKHHDIFCPWVNGNAAAAGVTKSNGSSSSAGALALCGWQLTLDALDGFQKLDPNQTIESDSAASLYKVPFLAFLFIKKIILYGQLSLSIRAPRLV
ncbi:hypothetical protein L1987_02238 [Smallanthus sonchifolius]|uniref:Uncharacterized protein n=1 Tax=Smallanthus sonchifolius TaxID=185202 RepID=A0ACB9K793_9ASTR|nr:hypothetical protein L1987_02238 [Smallanthus sonchifolius]